MRSRSVSLFSLSVSLLLLPLISGGLLNGCKPIADLNDPHVVEIAEFAVREHAKQSNQILKLQRVSKGETQVVAGTNYRLTLSVTDGLSAANDFVAVVWEKPWENFRTLKSFQPLQA